MRYFFSFYVGLAIASTVYAPPPPPKKKKTIKHTRHAKNIYSKLTTTLFLNLKMKRLILLSFAKAFDKVPHRRLVHKLEYYGIRGSTNKWINSWLSGRTQQVVLDGQASDPVPVLFGVPQGSVLGPVLFLIFINDLPDNIRYSVRLFADDCVLYRNIHSLQDCLTLQEDLTSLGQWEAGW